MHASELSLFSFLVPLILSDLNSLYQVFPSPSSFLTSCFLPLLRAVSE